MFLGGERALCSLFLCLAPEWRDSESRSRREQTRVGKRQVDGRAAMRQTRKAKQIGGRCSVAGCVLVVGREEEGGRYALTLVPRVFLPDALPS